MSRHRNVRNLDINAVLAEDDDFYEEEEEEFDDDEMTGEQKITMNQSIQKIQEMFGQDLPFPMAKVKETLWYYYFDVPQSVDYLCKNYLPAQKTPPKSKPKANNSDSDEINSDQDDKLLDNLSDNLNYTTDRFSRLNLGTTSYNSNINVPVGNDFTSSSNKGSLSLAQLASVDSIGSKNSNLFSGNGLNTNISDSTRPSLANSINSYGQDSHKQMNFAFPIRSNDPDFGPQSSLSSLASLSTNSTTSSNSGLSSSLASGTQNPSINSNILSHTLNSRDSATPMNTKSLSDLAKTENRNVSNENPVSLSNLAFSSSNVGLSNVTHSRNYPPSSHSMNTPLNAFTGPSLKSLASLQQNPINTRIQNTPSLSSLANQDPPTLSGFSSLSSLSSQQSMQNSTPISKPFSLTDLANNLPKNLAPQENQKILPLRSAADSSLNPTKTNSLSSLSSLSSQTPISNYSVSNPELPVQFKTKDHDLNSNLLRSFDITNSQMKPSEPEIGCISSSIDNLSISTSSSPLLSTNSKPSALISKLNNSICDIDCPSKIKFPSITTIPNHPLFSSPSFVAHFLFQQMPDNLAPIPDFNPFNLTLVDAKNKQFNFDKPSPDDIVHQAQSKKGATTNKKPSETNQSPSTKKNNNNKSKNKPNVDIEVDRVTFDIDALNLQDQKDPTLSTPPTPVIPAKLVNVEEEYAKRDQTKQNINLITVGHVDAGKSTLLGHLLYLVGVVDTRSMNKLTHQSEKIGKKSFAYAWVMDETQEERERGVTVDIAFSQFETDKHHFTLLDAPGHRDFIPNMISGAAQADIAILVVDASPGEFETGFSQGGQTKEHALLIRSLGVTQVAVAINKLDMVDWDQGRFNTICSSLGDFLMSAGFPKSKVHFVPCSGLKGENLITKVNDSHPLSAWYSGPSLLQVVDSFSSPTRSISLSLRLPVSDFFKGGVGSSGGISIQGRLAQGSIQLGETVIVMPGGEKGQVKTILVNEEIAPWAIAGDSVSLTLAGIDIMQFRPGSVICSPQDPIPTSNKFLAQILVFDIQIPITRGYPIILHHQSLNEPGYITKLVATLDKATGKPARTNPRHLSKGSTATVEITLDKAICLETYQKSKDLGRIMLRKAGVTIATGVVTEILS